MSPFAIIGGVKVVFDLLRSFKKLKQKGRRMDAESKANLKSVVGPAVTETLKRQDVPMDNAAVPATTAKVEAAVAAKMADAPKPLALVEVEGAAASKVNWAQILALVTGLLATFGIVIPEEWRSTILEVLAVATPVITIILRTFFSKKVLAPSLR
jgi:hypothetical protein